MYHPSEVFPQYGGSYALRPPPPPGAAYPQSQAPQYEAFRYSGEKLGDDVAKWRGKEELGQGKAVNGRERKMLVRIVGSRTSSFSHYAPWWPDPEPGTMIQSVYLTGLLCERERDRRKSICAFLECLLRWIWWDCERHLRKKMGIKHL